ncbi:MAG TPA: DsbA family protein [Nitrospira sp.]|nr:DsbA family protein [Nitrospira sp.]
MTQACWTVSFKEIVLAMSATAMLLVTPQVSFAESVAQSDSAPPHDLDAAIERYIRTHPEVIEQSLHALEVKREAEEKERRKAIIAARQDDLLNDPASPVSGNPTGTIALIEFFDYRCGYCKRAGGAVAQLQQEDSRVRVVYKDFPILGEPSELAAKAALSANLQGKHQVFHERVLASKNEMTKDELLRIAKQVDLDPKRLETDMANPEWQTIIDRNRALAKELGITGTPGFIVGTEMVPGALDVKGLKELIARAGENK